MTRSIMRHPVVFLVFCLAANIGCQKAATRESVIATALNTVRKAQPNVRWNEKSAVVADVTCDGSPDTVVVGSDKANVWVAVVPEKTSQKPLVSSFPIAADKQDGFCAVPTQIELSPLDCESDQGALPGCKPNESCQSFSVIDTECDPFNFYWDSSQKTLRWWRL